MIKRFSIGHNSEGRTVITASKSNKPVMAADKNEIAERVYDHLEAFYGSSGDGPLMPYNMAVRYMNVDELESFTNYIAEELGMDEYDDDYDDDYDVDAASNVMGNDDFESDETAIDELLLYATNDGNLYRNVAQPIMKNMMKKRASGKYDSELAVKGWQHLADAAVKQYDKEFGSGRGSLTFMSKPDRVELARQLMDYYEEEMEYEETNQ